MERANVEVNPAAEFLRAYRYVGAGGTVKRPTKIDDLAMIFPQRTKSLPRKCCNRFNGKL